ncbi:MAG: sortase [Lachnospiraceae bacterium]|nr:sortase [Lachnospiraceae bacterium]
MELKKPDKINVVRKMGRELYRLILFVFLVLGGALAIFASVELLIGTIGYIRTRQVYDDANDRFVSFRAGSGDTEGTEPGLDSPSSNEAVSENEAEEDPYLDIEVDLKALKEINDEVVGWLYFEDGLISYPVLFSGDNDKYLKRNYKEEYLASGSIFLEGQSARDFSDHYTLLYGHNMRDLTMFGKLRYYRSDKNYYKDHEYFRIITEDHVYRYRVFSFKQISSDSDVFSVIDKDSDGLKEFADKYLLTNNNVATEAKINDSDHVLALSTCVNDYAYRFIVCGVRIETRDTATGGSSSDSDSDSRSVSEDEAEEDDDDETEDRDSDSSDEEPEDEDEDEPVSVNEATPEAVPDPAVSLPAEEVNPLIQTPPVQNPAIQDPTLQNPSVQDPSIPNPAQESPENSATVVDVDI